MTLTPYKKVLGMTENEKDAMLLPIKIKTAKKQAELEIVKLEEEIALTENKINELASSPDLRLLEIARAFDNLGIIERRKKQFIQIVSELFSEE